MENQSTPENRVSRVSWQTLEEHVRVEAQKWVQRLLEEEVSDVLGRLKSERRAAVDGPTGYRNGYGKLRTLALCSGTVQLRRPRLRGLSERFESRVLPLFKRHTVEVGNLLPELYLHGLSSGDFDIALRGLLGEAAPLSASSLDRLKAIWQAEYESWKQRDLTGLEVVYLWVDGIYVKAGLEKERAAVLVVIAALRDGRKAILAVEAGTRESTEAWSAILRDRKARGLNCPRLVIGDGHLGIWGGLAQIFPEAQEQRCWNHRIVNVLDKLPKKDQGAAKELLTEIPYATTRQKAEEQKKDFQTWCSKRGHAGVHSCALVCIDVQENGVLPLRAPHHFPTLYSGEVGLSGKLNCGKSFRFILHPSSFILSRLQSFPDLPSHQGRSACCGPSISRTSTLSTIGSSRLSSRLCR
jgi:putative transposase